MACFLTLVERSLELFIEEILEDHDVVDIDDLPPFAEEDLVCLYEFVQELDENQKEAIFMCIRRVEGIDYSILECDIRDFHTLTHYVVQKFIEEEYLSKKPKVPDSLFELGSYEENTDLTEVLADIDEEDVNLNSSISYD